MIDGGIQLRSQKFRHESTCFNPCGTVTTSETRSASFKAYKSYNTQEGYGREKSRRESNDVTYKDVKGQTRTKMLL
jgi:hypothetical protein